MIKAFGDFSCLTFEWCILDSRLRGIQRAPSTEALNFRKFKSKGLKMSWTSLTACHYTPRLCKQPMTDGWCSKDSSTDGKCFVRLQLWVFCDVSFSLTQSINQAITPPDCKMDERKQQPQIDHCFHSVACWEVRAEWAALPLGHHSIHPPLPPPTETPKHDSKEFQFASDCLEGADGVRRTKWRRGDVATVMRPPGFRGASVAGSLYLAGCYQSLTGPFTGSMSLTPGSTGKP